MYREIGPPGLRLQAVCCAAQAAALGALLSLDIPAWPSVIAYAAGAGFGSASAYFAVWAALCRNRDAALVAGLCGAISGGAYAAAWWAR